MDVPAMVRQFRRRRHMSQREFAALSGIPRATLERIETGRTDPRVSTLMSLARLAGCYLTMVDLKGREIGLGPVDRKELFDRARRHFPAHLEVGPTPDYFPLEGRQWWGWHHIAFPPAADARRPENTYWRRTRPWPQMWFDAT